MTQTSAPKPIETTLSVLASTKLVIEWQKQRRDTILSELAFIEKQLIEAGEMSGPTTSELRKMYRNGELPL